MIFLRALGNRFFSVFGKDITYNDVVPKVNDVSLSNIRMGKIYDYRNKMDAKIREIENKEREEKRKEELAKKEEENKKRAEEEKRKREEKKEENKNSYSNSNNSINISSYGYGNSGESIYQKKQREAEEKKQRAAAAERKRIQDGLDRLEETNKSNQRKIDILNNAEKQGHDLINGIFGAINEDRAREDAVEEAKWKAQEEAEKERKRIRKEKARQAELKRKEEAKRVENIQLSLEISQKEILAKKRIFDNILIDQNLPTPYPNNKEAYLFFIIVEKAPLPEKYHKRDNVSNKINSVLKTFIDEVTSEATIYEFQLSSKNNQLPPKGDVLSKLKFETKPFYNPILFGLFESKELREQKIEKLKVTAQEAEIIFSKESFSFNDETYEEF